MYTEYHIFHIWLPYVAKTKIIAQFLLYNRLPEIMFVHWLLLISPVMEKMRYNLSFSKIQNIVFTWMYYNILQKYQLNIDSLIKRNDFDVCLQVSVSQNRYIFSYFWKKLLSFGDPPMLVIPCRVGSVGSVSASRTVGREFASRSGHTKDHHKNGTNCLPA